MTVRIVLADDHRLLRDGLRELLNRQPGLAVVGEAGDGRALLDLVAATTPDVVVLDVSMPGLNGIDAIHHLRSASPATRVVMLSMHADRRFVVAALQAGAVGYLLKDDGFDDLVQAIERVMGGHLVLAPSLTETLLTDYVTLSRQNATTALRRLSPREREVLQLVAEGHSTKAIAARLGVSVKTVETTRQHLMDKLGLYTVADLTKYALREGLTSIE